MNFVRHLLDWVDRFKNDDRLSPAHLALYFVLFHEWNRRGFVSPFPVLRDQMMGLAKIRSPNVYTRCMRELEHWGYIRYDPSFNQWEASQVHLFRFNKRNIDRAEDPDSPDFERKPEPRHASNLYENKGNDNSSDNATDNGIDKGIITASIPFNINELNNNTNKTNLSKYIYEHHTKDFDFSIGGRTPDSSASDHPDPDHQGQKGDKGGAPRDLEEVNVFFRQKEVSLIEAEQFYNYFESVGWKIGTPPKPVTDWRFAAKFWINKLNKNKNENDNNNESLTLRPGASQVRVDKSYDQPL